MGLSYSLETHHLSSSQAFTTNSFDLEPASVPMPLQPVDRHARSPVISRRYVQNAKAEYTQAENIVADNR
jgi:hypothetical protein